MHEDQNRGRHRMPCHLLLRVQITEHESFHLMLGAGVGIPVGFSPEIVSIRPGPQPISPRGNPRRRPGLNRHLWCGGHRRQPMKKWCWGNTAHRNDWANRVSRSRFSSVFVMFLSICCARNTKNMAKLLKAARNAHLTYASVHLPTILSAETREVCPSVSMSSTY